MISDISQTASLGTVVPAELEPHFSQSQLAAAFSFTKQTIVKKIRAGEFGARVILDGRQYRVPLSGVRFFMESHKI